MLHKIEKRIVDGLNLDEVVVVQHQDGLGGKLAQGVQQGSKHILNWRRR